MEEYDVGDIVVDAEGRTLYVFLADEGGESTCYDDCEAAWPPLTVDGEPVGLVETPVFSGTSVEPDALLVRTVEEIPGTFTAVAVADVAAVDQAAELITLRCTVEELVAQAALSV